MIYTMMEKYLPIVFSVTEGGEVAAKAFRIAFAAQKKSFPWRPVRRSSQPAPRLR